jgi:two-component system response regulator RegX3
VSRVLVVDDEPQILRALVVNMRARGYDVHTASDGASALRVAGQHPPDLVILDLGLPDLEGADVIAGLRGWTTAPIIVLTGRTEQIQKIAALDAGADDYVTKPFSSRELVARIRAVLRRGVDADDLVGSIVEAGPVRMDVERHTVSVDGRAVSLPLKEFDLLELLLRNAGRVLTRGQLIDRVWGADYVGDTKTLDVHVKRLRGKIEPDPANPKYLVTVRGLGYKFDF